MTVVELEDITVVRGGNTILDRVSWRIERGRHAVLLGANGSGKTTLLKVMTGYEWPTSGRVRVLNHGFGDCDLRTLRRHIGWVSSAMEHRISAHDPVLSVVGSGFDAALALFRPLSRAETARCESVLAHLGVGSLLSRPFGLLSQGEQKRVLIARAIVHDPALLVLDEPCAGLDPASRVDFLDDLEGFAADPHGPTILLVTHHVDEIRPWIHEALALRAGRVVKRGPCSTVLTDALMTEVFSRPCRVGFVDGERSLRFIDRRGG